MNSLKRFLSTNTLQLKRFRTYTIINQLVQVSFKPQGLTLLQLEINSQPTLFYINDKFSFGTLKSIIYYDFPNKTVDIDFLKSGLTMDCNVNDFLYSSNANHKSEVKIKLAQNTYILKNNISFQQNTDVQRYLTKVSQQKSIGISLMASYLTISRTHAISASQASILSYYVQQIYTCLPKSGTINNEQLVTIMHKSMNTHNPDSRQVLSNLTQAIQESKQALSSLQTKKAEIEQKVDKSMLTYLKGISMMMTCQWISFYHMIFNVDWLGWDIIEPVTYSIQSLSLLLAIRFYIRYKQDKTYSNVIHNYQHKTIFGIKKTRESYLFICQQLNKQQITLAELERKQKITVNKMTKSEFIL